MAGKQTEVFYSLGAFLQTVKAQAGTAEPTEASVQRYTEQCSPDPVDEVDDV